MQMPQWHASCKQEAHHASDATFHAHTPTLTGHWKDQRLCVFLALVFSHVSLQSQQALYTKPFVCGCDFLHWRITQTSTCVTSWHACADARAHVCMRAFAHAQHRERERALVRHIFTPLHARHHNTNTVVTVPQRPWTFSACGASCLTKIRRTRSAPLRSDATSTTSKMSSRREVPLPFLPPPPPPLPPPILQPPVPSGRGTDMHPDLAFTSCVALFRSAFVLPCTLYHAHRALLLASLCVLCL